MKITIFGSTGATGQELVKQALEKGYQVNTLVKTPHDISHPNLTVTRGDIFDIETVKKVIQGSDAVISVLGFEPKLFGEKSTDIYSRSASVFVKAMLKLHTKKLIFCSSAGVENDANAPLLYRYLFKPVILNKSYTDMQLAETIIGHTELDWILVRPSQLTDGPLTKKFRISARFRSKGGSQISRADLAYFILSQVESSEWVRQTPTLAY